MRAEERLVPKWDIGQKIDYVIYKHNTFKFKNEEGENIERTYRLQVTRLSETIVKAYFPDGILACLKDTTKATSYLEGIDTSPYDSFYYEIDEEGTFLRLDDLEDCINKLHQLKLILQSLIEADDPDDILGSLERFRKFPHLAESKLSEDVETIHEYYNAMIFDGYLFDLLEGSKIKKSISDKILSFLKLKAGKIELLQTDFLNNRNYQIELLKGSDTISDLKRQNINKIKKLFVENTFDVEKVEDFACRHQKYIYNKEDYLLDTYTSHFKLNSKLTDKQIRIKIKRVMA